VESSPFSRSSTAPFVDCDVHAVLASVTPLLPYLDDFRRDVLEAARFPNYVPNFHPPGAPITQRPGARVGPDGVAASTAADLCADLFADAGPDLAIVFCLYGIQQMHHPQNERMLARAVNRWLADEWLAADERLRGSLVLPLATPEHAAAEIDHWADDTRFVQVYLPGQSEVPYGRELWWPVWEAAERARMPIALHLGGSFRTPPTPVGWPSTYLEWYVGQVATMEAQLASIVSEGVLQRFPRTRVVVAETGFGWLPAFMWKFNKLWKGYRGDIPWVDRAPAELIREHVWVTTSPADGAAMPGRLDTAVERLGSESMLIYSSDYPHWHLTDGPALAQGTADPALWDRITRRNPAALYCERLGLGDGAVLETAAVPQ
jgi:predicted TIM-barrel fold metal-dependent hydrolase